MSATREGQACVCIERFKYQQLEKRLWITGLQGLGASKQSDGHAIEVKSVSNGEGP